MLALIWYTCWWCNTDRTRTNGIFERTDDLLSIEVEVSTLGGGQVVTTEILVGHNAVQQRSLREVVHATLKPWLDDKLLSKGFRIYIFSDDGKVLVTKMTPLKDVLSAASVHIVLNETSQPLPACPSSSSLVGHRHRSTKRNRAKEEDGELLERLNKEEVQEG